jgi:hypothetical protein
MATNDFIGFASRGSANVMSQADYAAAIEQGNGVQPGMASSALANKVWRQGANMAAVIGELIKNHGIDALDNGDLATLYNALLLATASTTLAGWMSAADKKKLDDIDIFVESGSTATSGLVPKPPTTPGTLKYLCEDAMWKVPPFVPKGNASVTISEEPLNVATSFITAFKANGVYYISFAFLLKSGLATWTDYLIAHLDVTGGAPLRTPFTLTSQSNGLSVPCVCETDGNITLTQKGVNFADDWLWGVAVVPIDM